MPIILCMLALIAFALVIELYTMIFWYAGKLVFFTLRPVYRLIARTSQSHAAKTGKTADPTAPIVWLFLGFVSVVLAVTVWNAV